MKTVTKKSFLKDMNYNVQNICYFIFMAAGIVMGTASIFYFGVDNSAGILATIIIVPCIIIPFGYFLGLRKIVITNQKISKVRKNRIQVVERRVIDKTRVRADDTKRYCQLVFGEEDGVWVSRTLDKQVKVGDICYLIYLEGDDEPSGIYNKKLYVLDDELGRLNQGLQE